MFMRMIYNEKLAQAAYLIGCQRTGEAIVVDPDRDADSYLKLAEENELKIVAVAETHIHADFVSGARELAERTGAHVYVSGEGGPDWTYGWLQSREGGGSYDHTLLHDGDSFEIGNIRFRAVHTPGHTPEHMVYVVTDAGSGASEPVGVLTGDFLFVGDLGRPDLLETAAGEAGAMEPSARALFRTVRTLDVLPEFAQVWPGHGAGSACGKELGAVPMSTLGYERRYNPALAAARDERTFVDFILSGQPEPPLYFATMKRMNKQGPPVLGGLARPAKIGLGALKGVDASKHAVVDTRPWARFRAGHLAGSLSLPVGRSFPTDAGSLIGASEAIYLIGTEASVTEAARDLALIGLDDVRGWCDASELDRAPGLETTDEIGVDDARAKVADGSAVVLDVRRLSEFQGGHIPGAVNVAHTRLASRIEEVPKDTPLLVNCRSGKRSARAVSYLQRRGYSVTNLAGGILAWESGGGAMA